MRKIKPNTRLSLPQAAEITGIGESTMRTAINNKRLRGERLGRDWRTTLEWIEVWVKDPEAHKNDPKRDERTWRSDEELSRELSISAA